MKQFKVFYERTEILYTVVEAETAEEAEELADTNYSDYDWFEYDGTLRGEILIGETEDYDE
jgi:hypothetical protein